ncbi:ferredoxin [Rhizobium sp. TH2]|uniref:ferredoxin n=1 Tax=Rhizobium sp. TH2 TaxID=2775403 RepID=UPI0021571066|nr:ferredoxin [Rhizobium sp. TH2]UVC11599.1 ferredoxin [Rhizobium sp. TH2]
MGKEEIRIDEIRAALSPHGIFLRGVVHFDGDGPEISGGRARTVVLLGNIGGSIWEPFSEWRQENENVADPLDMWSVEVIRPVAEAMGGTAWFPSEKPWQPFQQWAMRAEGLRASPLGVLIHPDYGLWHGYRGAIGFKEHIEFPASTPRPHPCDHCPDKPCLTTCPANAVANDHFHVPACRTYLAGEGDGTCMQGGCIARNACPVGASYRYPEEQLRFHMTALSR